MKKYLIVLAVAALTLVGCQKEVQLTGISIKPNAIEKFYVGDTTVLALVLTPKEAAKPTNVEWTSSDTTVIKVVGPGRIAAIAPGSANITAKVGELTAVCRVTANHYELFWNIDWLYYFPSTLSAAPLNDSTYTFAGKPCTLNSVTFFCPNSNDFDENLTSGSGECLFAEVSVLVYKDSVDEAGDRVIADKRAFKLVDTEEEWKKEPYTALKGQIDPAIAGAIFDEFLVKYAAGDASARPDWDRYSAEAAKGAHLCEAEVGSDGRISYTTAPFDALVSGEAERKVDASGNKYITYDVTVDWLGGLWGLAEDPNGDDEDPTTWLLKPYEVASYVTVHYNWENELGEIVTDAPQKRVAPAKKAAAFSPKKNFGKAVRYISSNNAAK